MEKAMRKSALAVILVGLFLTSCVFGPKSVDKSAVEVARVDGKAITYAELDSLAGALKITTTDSTNLDSLKRGLLDSLVEESLINQRIDSVKATINNDRELVERRNSEVANAVFKMMFDNEISFKVVLDTNQIDSFYIKNPDQFMTTEEVKAAQILVSFPKPDTADVKSEKQKKNIIKKNDQDTKKRAKKVYELAKAGDNWDSLVVKYSQDKATNKKGGDLGYFPSKKLAAELDSVIFKAKVGSIIGPIKTQFGYNIIRVDDHKMPVLKPLDKELRNKIRSGLLSQEERKRADKFVDSLKSEAQYVFNEDELAKPDSLIDVNAWAMTINAKDSIFESTVKNMLPKYMKRKGLTESTPEIKKEMLREIAVNNLLRAAGKTLGYYDKPEAVNTYESFNQREAKLKVEQMLRDVSYQPSQEEIDKYFKDNFEARYKEKNPLHVQHIIFADSAHALALSVRDSIIAGADFKEMALRYYPGEKEIREVAYDLGYISNQDMGEEFFNKVNELKVGEISQPIKTKWGYHIAKLIDRRTDKTLDMVRPGVRKALIEVADSKIKQQYIKQWRALAKIQIYSGPLKKYRFPEQTKTIDITPKG
jgi:parvulin-like peptidyl-prolyl isomerase